MAQIERERLFENGDIEVDSEPGAHELTHDLRAAFNETERYHDSKFNQDPLDDLIVREFSGRSVGRVVRCDDGINDEFADPGDCDGQSSRRNRQDRNSD